MIKSKISLFTTYNKDNSSPGQLYINYNSEANTDEVAAKN